MKSRDKQRFNRRIKEEMLDLKSMYAYKDPTPQQAVREIIKELKKKRNE